MDELVNHFNNNHHHLLFVLAGAALCIEALLGLTGPLLFFAIGSLLSAVLVTAGLLTSWEAETVSVVILTALSAALIWRPLKRLQNASIDSDNSSDMIGRVLIASSQITETEGKLEYSGTQWESRTGPGDAPIESGSKVKVVSIEGTRLFVIPTKI